MTFVTPDIVNKLANLSGIDANDAPFGIVKVDNAGKILMYNRYESEMAGVLPETAEGKSFFTEIAPCTNNKLFYGKFKTGIELGELDVQFNYTFTYKMKPTNVAIHMLHDKKSLSNWVFVVKK